MVQLNFVPCATRICPQHRPILRDLRVLYNDRMTVRATAGARVLHMEQFAHCGIYSVSQTVKCATSLYGTLLHMAQLPRNSFHNKQIGAWGEELTAIYYTEAGYQIHDRNYLKSWGEIDVVAEYQRKLYFIEVKTVSYETKADLEQSVLHGTWRPEENVTHFKLRKLSRAIESWLAEHEWRGDWQIDVAAVRVVPRETYATVNIIANVVL